MGKEITLDMLKVRTQEGFLVSVGEGEFGAIYADYLKNATQRNIVWKRRQLGMTTFSLARGFLKAAAGKECIIVAHRPDGVEHLWDMVEGFIDSFSAPLPIKWMNRASHTFGLDGKSPSQFQIVHSMSGVVGRGRMLDFIHFQEFAWWHIEDQKRAWLSLGPCLTQDAEVIIESTPDISGGGMFREIWDAASSYGFTRHFFPWWRDARYVAEAVDPKSLTKAEKELVSDQGLTLEQIGWRRKRRGDFMEMYGSDQMFKAEYGEVAV